MAYTLRYLLTKIARGDKLSDPELRALEGLSGQLDTVRGWTRAADSQPAFTQAPNLNTLGLVEAQEFRSGSAVEPGTGFTGLRAGVGPDGAGFAYNSVNHSLVSVANDVRKVGISIDDGTLYGTDVNLTGAITATSGAIGGWEITATTIEQIDGSAIGIVLDASVPSIKIGDTDGLHTVIDGANQRIRSSNYVAGSVGSNWDTATGDAEFNNLVARGKIKTSVFEKDTISAVGGNLLISAADVLAADMTAADSSTLTVAGDETFIAGNILRLKDGIDDEWLEVTSAASAPTYTVTRDKAAAYSANANPVWKKGQAVVNYGSSGAGRISMETGASAGINLFTHAGSPWSVKTDQVRLSTVDGALYFGAGAGWLDVTGQTIEAEEFPPTASRIQWITDDDQTKIAMLQGFWQATAENGLLISGIAKNSSGRGLVELQAMDHNGVQQAALFIDSAKSLLLIGSRAVSNLAPTSFQYMTPVISDFLSVDDKVYVIAALAAGGAVSDIPASEAVHPGIVRLASVATNNTGGRIRPGTNTSAILLGGGETFSAVFRQLSVNANVVIRIGFQDSVSATAPTDAVYIDIQGATLQGTGKNNGGTTNTGTSYTVSVNTWYRIIVEVTSSSLATFYLYDVSSAALLWSNTIATNIPTATGRETDISILAYRATNVATDLIDVDWAAFYNSSLIRI